MDEKSQLLEGYDQGNKYQRSIYIMLFVNFLSSVCFSIVLPSLWPFIHSLPGDLSYGWVGWAVSVNSLGSFLASPVFGWWLDKRTTREVLLFSLVVMIVGNGLYSASTNIWVLLTARFVVGVAAANYAIAQTYLAYATTQDDRTKIMAYNSATTVLGFIFGPAFALGLSFLPEDPPLHISSWVINKFTSPGVLSAIFSIGALFAAFSLQEVAPEDRGDGQKKNTGINQPQTENGHTENGEDKKPVLQGSISSYSFAGSHSSYNYEGSGFYAGSGSVKDIGNIIKATRSSDVSVPWLPVVVCLWFYFTFTAAFTVWETIGTPYTENDFGWDVFDNSLMFAAMGLLCIVALMLLQVLNRSFSDRILLIASTVLFIVGFGILISWDHPVKPVARFLGGAAGASIGYATSVAVLISIYTKVLEGAEQGVLMGWLSSSGSVARIVGPLFASYSLKAAPSGRILFTVTTILLGISLVLAIVFYRKLAPRPRAFSPSALNF